MSSQSTQPLSSRLRNTALTMVGRSARLKQLAVGILCSRARRRDAVAEVIRDARDGAADRPLDRSAQMIVWAERVMASDRPVPRHFDPAEHIESKTARAAAKEAIEQQLAAGGHVSEAALRTQLLRLTADRPLGEVRRDVEQQVNDLLLARATRPAAGKPGLAPELQLEIITDLTERLGVIDIRPFLMSGTLLGIIRDGDFMPHDYDIDLGLMPSDNVDAAADLLDSVDGYEVSVHGDRVVVEHTSGARTDLFPHTDRDGKFWHGTLVHEWWNTPFELLQRDVMGTQCWVPSDPELYLDENYGDWRSPVAFYDISFDTPNREYRQTATALLHLHSRCVLALENNDRWLLESSVRELKHSFGVDATRYLAVSGLLRE